MWIEAQLWAAQDTMLLLEITLVYTLAELFYT